LARRPMMDKDNGKVQRGGGWGVGVSRCIAFICVLREAVKNLVAQ
jgi:hypothetical protein